MLYSAVRVLEERCTKSTLQVKVLGADINLALAYREPDKLRLYFATFCFKYMNTYKKKLWLDQIINVSLDFASNGTPRNNNLHFYKFFVRTESGLHKLTIKYRWNLIDIIFNTRLYNLKQWREFEAL